MHIYLLQRRYRSFNPYHKIVHLSALVQAKKRTAADCRARFLMLMRARQTAKVPYPIQLPASAAMHTQGHPLPFTSPGLAAPTLAGTPLGPQSQAHLLANALAMQSRPAPSPAASGQQAPTVAAVPTAQLSVPQPAPAATVQSPAAATPAVLNSNGAVPMNNSAQQRLDSPRAIPVAVAQPSSGTPAPSAATALASTMPAGILNTNASSPKSNVGLAAPVGHAAASSSAPFLTVAPASPASATLAYLLAAKSSQAAASNATASASPAAVAGGGRSMRLLHRSSADVLQVKLRLVDLVQGSAALQPKVPFTMPSLLCEYVLAYFGQ